jgi:hypothetical protein
MKELLTRYWSQIKKRIDLSRLGTHIQIGLTAVIFILFLITTHETRQVSENAARIEIVRREIVSYRDSVRYLDIERDSQVAEIGKAVRLIQEVTVKQDLTVLRLQRDMDAMVLKQRDALLRIDKFNDKDLVNFFGTKPLKK